MTSCAQRVEAAVAVVLQEGACVFGGASQSGVCLQTRDCLSCNTLQLFASSSRTVTAFTCCSSPLWTDVWPLS